MDPWFWGLIAIVVFGLIIGTCLSAILIGVRYFNERLTIFIKMVDDYNTNILRAWDGQIRIMDGQIRIMDQNVKHLAHMERLVEPLLVCVKEQTEAAKSYDEAMDMTIDSWRERLGMDPVPGPKEGCTCDNCVGAIGEEVEITTDTYVDNQPKIVLNDEHPEDRHLDNT
jgi:hypothetical protein